MDLNGKAVFVAGGSRGLGREIAKIVASQGAQVIIFACKQNVLDEAKKEILAVMQNSSQEVTAVSLDMSNSYQVDTIMNSQTRLPDILYCVAGGTATQCGFMTDIRADDLDTCMRNNYYTSTYMSHWALKAWTQDDLVAPERPKPRLRQLVFINSMAAFIGLPGYTAYTPSKCAVRALADTLGMEALRYSSKVSTYAIHCAFPSNFITQSFFEEKKKPTITKDIEGTMGSVVELEKKFPSAEKVARQIATGVARGDFALCDDSTDSALFFAKMIGPSPKRCLGVVDSIFAIFMGFFVWPILRRRWDQKMRTESSFV